MDERSIIELITIDDTSSIPIYIQLRNRITYLIISEQLAIGDKLPTVRELAVHLGVTYNTTNRAYMDLERDGYIVSRRRKGTFVSSPAKEISEQDDVRKTVASLIENLIEQCDELGVPRSTVCELVKMYAENI